MSRCDAISRNGSRCKNQAFVGRTKCRMHGGATCDAGAPRGNQNPIKHGIYAKLFDAGELDSAADMQGSVSTELAIARLQLARLLKKMQQDDDDDAPKLDAIEEKTLAADDNTDRVRSRRAKDAERFGEYYDADDDDHPIDRELERKKVFKRRDWSVEFTRLTGLIARLEMQLLTMQHKKAEIKAVERGEEQKGDAGELTSTQLDAEICGIIDRFAP